MAEPIHLDDNETIFRRIPVSMGWYDTEQKEVKPDAFKPTKHDITGLSVSRIHSETHPDFLNLQQFAQGSSRQGYYVVQLSVKILRKKGVDIVAKPLHGNPGHAEWPQLTYENRKENCSQELMLLLAHELAERVLGPFLTESP